MKVAALSMLHIQQLGDTWFLSQTIHEIFDGLGCTPASRGISEAVDLIRSFVIPVTDRTGW